MKLETELSLTRIQIDEISRLEYDNGILTVYFSKSLKIGDEEMEAVFDISNPVKPNIAEIQDALDTIFTSAFQARTTQLSPNPLDSTLILPPNYKAFYSELLTTELFGIARYSAGEDIQSCIAYSDFALALTNSIAGNENPIAFQICLNNMIGVLGDKVNSDILEVLRELINENNLPLTI